MLIRERFEGRDFDKISVRKYEIWRKNSEKYVGLNIMSKVHKQRSDGLVKSFNSDISLKEMIKVIHNTTYRITD